MGTDLLRQRETGRASFFGEVSHFRLSPDGKSVVCAEHHEEEMKVTPYRMPVLKRVATRSVWTEKQLARVSVDFEAGLVVCENGRREAYRWKIDVSVLCGGPVLAEHIASDLLSGCAILQEEEYRELSPDSIDGPRPYDCGFKMIRIGTFQDRIERRKRLQLWSRERNFAERSRTQKIFF